VNQPGSSESVLSGVGESADAVPVIPPERAFGEKNRVRLLTHFFDGAGPVTPGNAWEHVYRLLLWIDRTTGLAHCYESDKCQEGRPWYARSLAFHEWVSEAMRVGPEVLADEIDILFKQAVTDLIAGAAKKRALLTAAAETQRAVYAGKAMPQPGDPALEAILTEVLAPYLSADPPPHLLRSLARRVQEHVGLENKRKNLVGEGFEDTLSALLRRTPGVSSTYDIHVRPALHALPGFNLPRGNAKPRQVDLALVRRADGHRTLVSCKWSVRSDREEQFVSDYDSYEKLEAAGTNFSYGLVTNEFDPARLAAACEVRLHNSPLFTDVVHVNPEGPVAAYAAAVGNRMAAETRGQGRAQGHITSGRLMSLESWISQLQG
jgi:hypothetical protein